MTRPDDAEQKPPDGSSPGLGWEIALFLMGTSFLFLLLHEFLTAFLQVLHKSGFGL
jgi:hypothetical protein